MKRNLIIFLFFNPITQTSLISCFFISFIIFLYSLIFSNTSLHKLTKWCLSTFIQPYPHKKSEEGVFYAWRRCENWSFQTWFWWTFQKCGFTLSHEHISEMWECVVFRCPSIQHTEKSSKLRVQVGSKPTTFMLLAFWPVQIRRCMTR